MANINLAELCQAIAEALGPEWSSWAPQKQTKHGFLVRTTDGLELFCAFERENEIYIKTTAIQSMTEDGIVIFRHNYNNPSLTLDATRTPSEIALIIKHQLLPTATNWWQQGMIGKQVAEEQYAQAKEDREKLLAFPGATTVPMVYIGDHTKVHGPDYAWRANINLRLITFNSLTVDQMVAMIEAYNQLKG